MAKLPALTPQVYFNLGILLAAIPRWLFPQLDILPLACDGLGKGLAIVGLVLNIWPWFLFNQKNFSHRLVKPAALITEGPYRFSRNPMYLGMFLVLIGLALWIRNPLSLIAPTLYFLACDLLYVPAEERILQATFGKDYDQYAQKVRRWI